MFNPVFSSHRRVLSGINGSCGGTNPFMYGLRMRISFADPYDRATDPAALYNKVPTYVQFTHSTACAGHCRTAAVVISLYEVTKLLEKQTVTSAGLEVGLQTH